MKAVIEPMTAAGGGSIINISSIEGFTGAAGLSAYSASKFAIRGMTKVAAQELGQFGIRVNSVHPGGVLTSMVLERPGTGPPARRTTAATSSSRCRWPGSRSRPRSPGWWRSWPPTRRPTRPAASSSPTAASCPGPATDQMGASDMGDTLTLDGRTAIVTGAGNGLGRAEALALAAAGARLVLNDLPGDAVQAVADEIAAAGGQARGGRGRYRRLGDRASNWSTAALDAYGRLDILVNNAGVLRDRMIFSMSAEEWDLVLRVHLRGHFVTTRFATAYWREASKQAGGPGYGQDREHLVRGVPARLARPAQLRRGQGRDHRPHRDHGAQLRPVRGARQRHLPARPDRHDRGPDGRGRPTARWTRSPPEHVAPLVVYLASPAADGINGEVFVVHGGVAAVMEPPRIRATVLAAEHGSRRWHVDAGVSAAGPGPDVHRRPGRLGRVRLRGHARPGERDHRLPPVKSATGQHVRARSGSAGRRPSPTTVMTATDRYSAR